jgi:cell wall-associated NlpC family hydrolase
VVRGDILLYPSQGHWWEWFITTLTRGPYVHVSVDLGDGSNIAAHPSGVSRDWTGDDSWLTRVSVNTLTTDAQAVERGIKFLEAQLGKPYSWLDIVSAGLHAVGIPLFIGAVGHFDCSALVAAYLDLITPTDFTPVNDIISPNDIARALHVQFN